MSTIDNAETELAALTLNDIVARHRREKKELQAKIQALKKAAPKNDKKKRKDAMEEVQRMETELDERHKAELKAAEEAEANTQIANIATDSVQPQHTANGGDDGASEPEPEQQPQQRISKAQRRRDKKARETQEREKEIRDELNSTDPEKTTKAIELKQINDKLAERNLLLHQITSDGNCLFNAVRHQLTLHGLPIHSVSELRAETANYIQAHKDELICYMTNSETGDLLNDEEFDNYCDSVRNTCAWGGQVELKALSSVLKVPIEVLQAVGPPTVLGADEFSDPKLIITYHRHMYQLGEHYNSTLSS